ncbi:MAG: class I SAM-dependent methyltransferase [Comamonas sp.]
MQIPSPSPWITRFAPLFSANGQVLDVACGSGRHARYLHSLGMQVTGVDRDSIAIAALRKSLPGTWVEADIENGPWPFAGQQFDAVVATNYLWRPLLPQILASVAPGGLLLYETFADGNAAFGKPSRPDFLLHAGELLQVCSGWHIMAYEHGKLTQPDRIVQRIAARNSTTPALHYHTP